MTFPSRGDSDEIRALLVQTGKLDFIPLPPAEYGTGMTLPFAMGSNKQVHPEPGESWPLRALAVGADDIAREVVAGLMLRLQAGR